ncbi:unnamed protein product [Lactuca saligna]|uniref:DNA helicase n=1 Tax=Lactuca saligna TaxID=75948 RepID=A0AA36EQ83_LACSI|nr:unnamed protein product [Lactuca saligna]
MVHTKPILKQVKEFQVIAHDLEVEAMRIKSNVLIGAIIEKLPLSWRNFKLYLKQLTVDMSFEQLVLRIHVEEDNILNEKANANSLEPSANVFGQAAPKTKHNNNKGKNGSKNSSKYGKNHVQNKKNLSPCYVCVRTGHKARDCRFKTGQRGNGGGSNGRNNGNNAILSRFDLVYVMINDPDDTTDFHIASHIVRVHQNRENDVAPAFTTEQLKRYIQVAKGDTAPGSRVAYHMTLRQLEALIRLSEAIARCHLDDEVHPRHVKLATRLLKASVISVMWVNRMRRTTRAPWKRQRPKSPRLKLS